MQRSFILAFLMLLIPMTPFNAAAQRLIVNSDPFTVYVDDNYKCRETIQVIIMAPHKRLFKGNNTKLEEVVKLTLATLAKQCFEITRIDISGEVDQKQVYKGYMTRNDRWILRKTKMGQKSISLPRTKTDGQPYMNSHNELVVHESAPFTISSPFKSEGGRLKVNQHVDTISEWCYRSPQPFLFEYDGDWKHRNSYFEPGFEKFFMDKIFPAIEALCGDDSDPPEGQMHLFFMRNRNEKEFWDSFKINVAYKPGIYEIKSLTKSYDMIGARNHITGKERGDLFNKMNRRWLINGPEEAIYEDDLIRIHSHNNGEMVNHKIGMPGWCEKPELNIVYKMPLEERDQKVSFEYLSPIVFNIAKQHCDVPAVVYLYFYPENEESHWDETMYQFCKLGGVKDSCRPDNTKVEYGFELGRSEGPLQTLALIKKYRENPYYMWECEKGMFCDLPGGKYLTAIYEKDLDTIKEMDNLAHRELIGALREWQTKTGLGQLGLDLTQQVKPVSLLLEVANQYMYHYQFNNQKCLGSNSVTKTYSHTAETIRYKNMYGMDMGSVGGWTAHTSYTVNPEFQPLLVKLGKFALFSDVEVTAKYLKLNGLERTGQDVKFLQKNYDCNSPEIKRFEKNLIELATLELDGDLKNLRQSKKTSSPKKQNKTAPESKQNALETTTVKSSNSEATVTAAPVKKVVDTRPERFINTQKSSITDFPKELVMSPLVNDFLLARYYPDLLSQQMLEAMLSSRWSYERSQEKPLGGRFFKPDTQPEYKDIQKLSEKFSNWLKSRSKALPENFILEVPLEYALDTMWIKSPCINVIPSDNAPTRISQDEQERANREIKQCEERNRRFEQHFNSCENTRRELEQAKQKLAQAKAAGCQSNSDDASEDTSGGDVLCELPNNLSKANMQDEMMKCMTSACGTPSATTDMLAYQKCVKAVSELFQNQIMRQMGLSPIQQTNRPSDSCLAIEKEIQPIEQHLASFRCDLISEKPTPFNCASMSKGKQPEFMPVQRIELSHMQVCNNETPAYNRLSNSSAELLPGRHPLAYTNYNFILVPDKLALPYDSPHTKRNGDKHMVIARMGIRIKDRDNHQNRRSQYSLAVQVEQIDYVAK